MIETNKSEKMRGPWRSDLTSEGGAFKLGSLRGGKPHTESLRSRKHRGHFMAC